MLYFIFAFLIVLVDQVVKYLITVTYSMGGQLDIIPGIFRITYVSNSGGAFSIFADHTLILAIVSVVACALIIFLMIKGKMSALGRLSLCFILGGAIGNMIDRFALGYVVDMFQPTFIDFAVFNVADIFITVGAVLLIIYVIFFWRPGKNKASVGAKKSKRRSKYDDDNDDLPIDQLNAFGDTPTEDTIIAPSHPSQNRSQTPRPASAPSPSAAPGAPKADTPASGEKKEPTFEEIMREYGHDI